MLNNLEQLKLVNVGSPTQSKKIAKVLEALQSTPESTLTQDFTTMIAKEAEKDQPQQQQPYKKRSLLEQKKREQELRSLRQECFARSQREITKKLQREGAYHYSR